MLVLQLSYLSLIDQKMMLECMAGLQLAGKYTLGFGLEIFGDESAPDLLALGLDSNALNSFLVIFCFLLVSFISSMILMVIERN